MKENEIKEASDFITKLGFGEKVTIQENKENIKSFSDIFYFGNNKL